MLYQPFPDIIAPDEADLDDPAMALAAAAIERGEQDLRILTRLAEIAMELAEAQGVYAKARLTAVNGAGGSLGPNEDPAGPFNKIAQTVRRILALRAKLAEEVKTSHADLIGKRTTRRAKRRLDLHEAKFDAIESGLVAAVVDGRPDLDVETAQSLFDEVDELLYDSDEFADFPDRPIGETISRLCKALGLDPDFCVPDGDGWKIRSPLSSHSWAGTDGEAVRVGNAEASETHPAKPPTPTDPGASPAPHPDAFSVCPSP